MSLVSAYLNQTITRAPYSTLNVNGKKSFGEAEAVSARVDYRQVEKKVMSKGTAKGELHISTAQIMMEGDQSITLNDRITLPDGTKPPILAIEKIPDVSGTIVLQVVYT